MNYCELKKLARKADEAEGEERELPWNLAVWDWHSKREINNLLDPS